MTALHLSMLGRLGVSLDDLPTVKFRTKRAQALLAYLVTEEAPDRVLHKREALMELLWPGLPPKSARSNLRQTLYYLRQAVVDLPSSNGEDSVPLLLTDRSTVGLNPAYPLDADVLNLSRLLAGTEEHWPEAIDLYRGDFLADFYLPDANTFEEWAAGRRAAYRRQVLDALDRLTVQRLVQADYVQAERYALRQLEIDNLREGAYRALMQLYAWSGRQSEASSIYQDCVRVLDEEVGSPPDEATTSLYEAIRENRLPPPPIKPQSEIPAPAEERAVMAASPYRGLFAFREEDAAYFFGREVFTERLVEAVKERPLVAVIGPSGSGKSSVLHAGLLARLNKESEWNVAAFRPGSQPFYGLAAALLPLLEPEMTETDRLLETRKMARVLETGDLPLSDVIDRCRQMNPKAPRLMLVLDKFEELYTLGPSLNGGRRFLDAILEAVINQRAGSKHAFSLVLALRADFLDQVLSYRRFADALQDSTIILGPMTHEELAEAIVKPAAAMDVAFESGLAERILGGVGDEPGNLPLLAFALAILWDRQSNSELTHEAYDAIGGVDGALARYADEVFDGLDEVGQRRARHVFVQLVRPGLQTGDTRRLARRMELGAGNWELAHHLADARLVVIGRDPAGQETAELAHDTLIRRWGRLRDWLEEDRAFRIWQERLRAALGQWEASEKDEGALLRGAPLTEADSWLSESRDQLSAVEIAFIEASCALHNRQEAEQEQARAARERTRRIITFGLAIGMCLAIGLALLAAWQWNNARQARFVAEGQRDQTQKTLAQSLASQAQLLIDDQLDLALLLAVEAFYLSDSLETRGNLLSAVSQDPNLRAYLHGHEDQVRSVVLSPDGRTFASGGDDNVIRLWDLETGQPIGPPINGHTDNVRGLAFSPDGRLLASASFDDTVMLWDVESGQAIGPHLDLHSRDVWSVAFSPDGELLASGDADGVIRFWDAGNGKPLGTPLSAHSATVAALAFSPSGNILFSAGRDDSLHLWAITNNTSNPDALYARPLALPLKGHSGIVRAMSISPDGQILAMDGDDNTIVLWDLAAVEAVAADAASAASQGAADLTAVPVIPIGPPLVGHNDWITSLAFAADNTSLASASKDGQVIIWDISSVLGQGETIGRSESQSLAQAGQPIWSLAFAPDGHTVIGGTADGRLILWDMTGPHPLSRQFPGPASPEQSLAFSSDGQILVAGDRDNNVNLYDVDENSRAFGQTINQPLTEHDNRVYGAAFSPDGTTLATSDRDGNIILRDSRTWSPIMPPLTGHEDAVWDVAFSPDSRFLASGSADNTVRIWDAVSGDPLLPPLIGHQTIRGSLDHSGIDPWRGSHRVLFSPEGDWLVSTGAIGDVILWDLAVLAENDSPGGDSSEIQAPVPRFTWRLGRATSDGLAFSPDGRILASSTINGMIFLHDVISGEQIGEPLLGHSTAVDGITFSPEGDMMVSVSSDGQLIFWNMVEDSVNFGRPYGPPIDGPPLFRLPSIAVTPDGLQLASISAFRNIIIWDISVDSWLSHACRRANRNLTGEEWRRFFGDEPYRLTCPDLPPASDA
ncbi:MAG: BTAD domain-containing putative transcriptional regulator [Candidatus Promineifilaceae bacterium]